MVDLNQVSDVPKPPYVEIQFPVSSAKIATAGTTYVNRESGAARIVFSESAFSEGWKARLLGWADEVADLFRAKQFAGVETFEVSPPVIDDRNKGGNKFSVAIVATYKFDAIKS